MISLNVGNLDRFLRMLAGMVLLGMTAAGLIGWWGLIGFVPLATGAMAWCPLYRMFGLRTTSR